MWEISESFAQSFDFLFEIIFCHITFTCGRYSINTYFVAVVYGILKLGTVDIWKWQEMAFWSGNVINEIERLDGESLTKDYVVRNGKHRVCVCVCV
jgi:hypothetical protein